MDVLSPTPSADEALVKELHEAVEGLLYPSESDEPFDVFCWPAIEPDALSQIACNGVDVTERVETSAADFFAELLTGTDGKRYAKLKGLLESRVAHVRVLRLGQVEVNVYVIGLAPGKKNWVGIHTISVET